MQCNYNGIYILHDSNGGNDVVNSFIVFY